MQINSNTSLYTNVGTNNGGYKSETTREQPRSVANPVTKQAIKPEGQVEKALDQNDRAKQLARNAYAGASQRGSIVNILV